MWPMVLEGRLTTKIKYIITIKKKKKIGPIGVRAPLSPHLGLSLLKKKYKVDRSLEKI